MRASCIASLLARINILYMIISLAIVFYSPKKTKNNTNTNTKCREGERKSHIMY